MSKYFKNYKSEGDGDNRPKEKSRIYPRSYSCKPDIGPSGDKKSLERDSDGSRNGVRVNKWLNNKASGRTENTNTNNDLYRLNEDHLENINFIRRKLHMTELKEGLDSEATTEELCSKQGYEVDDMVHNKFIRNNSDMLWCSPNDDSHIYEPNYSRRSPVNRKCLVCISKSSKVSVSSNDSYKYKPPLKKICLHAKEPRASVRLPPINMKKTDDSESDITESLDSAQTSHRNENKSIQCTSKDTELTEYSLDSTNRSKTNYHHQGDNIDLVSVDVYTEPEIILNQSVKCIKDTNKSCIKFLPIKDEQLPSTDNSRMNRFYDEIISKCSFSYEHLPTPSHDSFFKSRKNKRKKKLKKRGRSTTEETKLDKANIEVHRTFLNTDASKEIETIEMPVIGDRPSISNFDKTLMTSLAMPSKTVKPLKIPIVTKFSQLIHGDWNNEGEKLKKIVFDDDICSGKKCNRQRDNYGRTGTEYCNCREAEGDFMSRRHRPIEDINVNEVADIHKTFGKYESANKWNTKKKQCVDYDFYSKDLPLGRTCDGVDFGQVTEEDSDSGCLRATEDCCCLWRIFKKRRSTIFPN